MKRICYIMLNLLLCYNVQAQQSTSPFRLSSQSTNELEVGQVVEVKLGINKNTGYVWEYKMDVEGIVKYLSDREVVSSSDAGVGMRIWVFKVLKEGDCRLSFEYVAEGEKKAAKETSFHLHANQSTSLDDLTTDCREPTIKTWNTFGVGEQVCVSLSDSSNLGKAMWYAELSKPGILEFTDTKFLAPLEEGEAGERKWEYRVIGRGKCELRFRQMQFGKRPSATQAQKFEKIYLIEVN